MKAILIDDENKARRLLEALLIDTCPEIKTIFQAENLIRGVKLIEEESPDIVFLDIEMPKHSGLQILEFFEGKKVNFQIIFVTAYNEYAIEAFKLSAVDYLLKPIDVCELKLATNKAFNLIQAKNIDNKFDDLKKAFEQLSLNKIAVEVPRGVSFISHDDIQLFEADGMYTKIYLKNGETELICKPLKHFVDQLDKKPIFYKPHRSYLVNLKHIKELYKKDGFYLLLDSGKTVPISKDKKTDFLQLVQDMF